MFVLRELHHDYRLRAAGVPKTAAQIFGTHFQVNQLSIAMVTLAVPLHQFDSFIAVRKI